eukprot:scaffold30148_cov81-Attheya_sp.AAC.1
MFSTHLKRHQENSSQLNPRQNSFKNTESMIRPYIKEWAGFTHCLKAAAAHFLHVRAAVWWNMPTMMANSVDLVCGAQVPPTVILVPSWHQQTCYPVLLSTSTTPSGSALTPDHVTRTSVMLTLPQWVL